MSFWSPIADQHQQTQLDGLGFNPLAEPKDSNRIVDLLDPNLSRDDRLGLTGLTSDPLRILLRTVARFSPRAAGWMISPELHRELKAVPDELRDPVLEVMQALSVRRIKVATIFSLPQALLTIALGDPAHTPVDYIFIPQTTESLPLAESLTRALQEASDRQLSTVAIPMQSWLEETAPLSGRTGSDSFLSELCQGLATLQNLPATVAPLRRPPLRVYLMVEGDVPLYRRIKRTMEGSELASHASIIHGVTAPHHSNLMGDTGGMMPTVHQWFLRGQTPDDLMTQVFNDGVQALQELIRRADGGDWRSRDVLANLAIVDPLIFSHDPISFERYALRHEGAWEQVLGYAETMRRESEVGRIIDLLSHGLAMNWDNAPAADIPRLVRLAESFPRLHPALLHLARTRYCFIPLMLRHAKTGSYLHDELTALHGQFFREAEPGVPLRAASAPVVLTRTTPPLRGLNMVSHPPSSESLPALQIKSTPPTEATEGQQADSDQGMPNGRSKTHTRQSLPARLTQAIRRGFRLLAQ